MPMELLNWPMDTYHRWDNTLLIPNPIVQIKNETKSSLVISFVCIVGGLRKRNYDLTLTCRLMLSRLHGKQNLWWFTDGHCTKCVSSSRSWHNVHFNVGFGAGVAPAVVLPMIFKENTTKIDLIIASVKKNKIVFDCGSVTYQLMAQVRLWVVVVVRLRLDSMHCWLESVRRANWRSVHFVVAVLRMMLLSCSIRAVIRTIFVHLSLEINGLNWVIQILKHRECFKSNNTSSWKHLNKIF